MLGHTNRQPGITVGGRRARGFSLIELLVVIFILGLLAAIVAFSITGPTTQGNIKACKIEARTVKAAVESYFAKNGVLPATSADLVPDYLPDAPQNVDYLPVGYTPRIQWRSSGPSHCTPGSEGLNQFP